VRTMPIPASLDPRFSRELPGLQLQVNSSSLGPFKECPRKYYYSILLGLRPREAKVDLQFGTWVHEARAGYDMLRNDGADHEQAVEAVLESLLKATWNSELGRPWFSESPQKTRIGLLRTMVWYFDQFGESDPFQTLRLADGKPAVELGFKFDSGVHAESTGEPIQFYGTLDRIASMNGEVFLLDTKTTKSTVNQQFLQLFSPDNQFSLYIIAARTATALPIRSLVLDAIQIGTDFSRFQRGLVQRTDDQCEEWLEDASEVLRSMERAALRQYWPQNDKSCGFYGGCQFRQVCGSSPARRQQMLDREFVKEAPKAQEDRT
jgi:hypothetical protein